MYRLVAASLSFYLFICVFSFCVFVFLLPRSCLLLLLLLFYFHGRLVALFSFILANVSNASTPSSVQYYLLIYNKSVLYISKTKYYFEATFFVLLATFKVRTNNRVVFCRVVVHSE